jgi:hypothetical protein
MVGREAAGGGHAISFGMLLRLGAYLRRLEQNFEERARRPRTARDICRGVIVLWGLIVGTGVVIWFLPVPRRAIWMILSGYVGVGLFITADMLVYARKVLFNERVASGRCVYCGYDLRASALRCPECGAKPFIRRFPD